MTSGYDADPIFQATPRQIDNLIHRIHDGSLTIPDFQRDFTWEPKRTQELIRSVMSRYPAGTLLFWAMGGDNDAFGWRPVEGAPNSGLSPQELILDGQQRLTCLYRALNGVGEERFYVSLSEVIDSDSGEVCAPSAIDFDKAIFWRDVNSKEASLLETDQIQFEQSIFPLHKHREFDEWLDHYISYHQEVIDVDATKKRYRKIRDQFLTPLKSYGFPVVTLPASTSIDAVCNVFETLNKTGKPLGAFELLTARFYPKDVKLRDLWNDALAANDELGHFGIEPYSMMQAVALRARRSAQRSTVLVDVTAEDVQEHWESCVRGYVRVLDMLSSECGIISSKWLPYSMLLVPMAAVWEEVSQLKGPLKQAAIDRLKRYFWCSVFTSNFDQGANSQAGADYVKLSAWIIDEEAPSPEALSELNISASVLASATTRRKAIYSGLLALSVQNGARDFHSGQKLTAERIRLDRIDSHHVFPKAYLTAVASTGEKAISSELALNRVLLDPGTNKIIGKNPPSSYVAKLQSAIIGDAIVEILDSHLIDNDATDALLKDDYNGFIDRRLDRVIEQIELVTGRKVTRDEARL